MADFEWDDTYDNPAHKDDYIDDEDEVNQTYQDLTSDLSEQPLDPDNPQISDNVWDVRALDTAVNQVYTDAYSKWGIEYEGSIDLNKFEINDGRLYVKKNS